MAQGRPHARSATRDQSLSTSYSRGGTAAAEKTSRKRAGSERRSWPRPIGIRDLQFQPLTDRGQRAFAAIILHASEPELSNNIIQKGLAFGRHWSGTVANPGRPRALRDPAPPARWPRWGFGGAARRRKELNGESQCQSLRRNDQLCHQQHLFLLQSHRNSPLAIPRVRRSILARSNLASSRCCNHPPEQRLPR